MSERYPHLFSPIRIGPVEVPNRFYLGSHSNPLAAPGIHGSAVPSEAFARYYGERARAGVGLLIHSLPVLTALRHRYPDAHITWVVNRGYAPLLEGHPDLNEVLPFDRKLARTG